MAATTVGSTRVQAQTVEPVEFIFADVPLNDALRALVDRTQIALLYESRLVQGRRTTCRIRTPDPVRALACVLVGTGLDYVTLSSGVTVLVTSSFTEPVFATVIGRVLDRQTGTPISRAHVRDLATGFGATTDKDGRFVLGGVASGPHPLSVSHVAFDAKTDTVWVAAGTVHTTVVLNQRVVEGDAIIVTGLELVPPGAARIDGTGLIENARALATGAAGGADRIVGVRNDRSGGGLQIEGGAPGEHELQIDGIPVFVPVRNGGIFGPFSPLAVRALTVHRSGFRARDGSTLSGGVNAEHALSEERSRNLVVQISPFALDGRVGSAHPWGAWMVAGRSEAGRWSRPRALDNRLKEWSRPDPYLARELFRADPAELERLSGLLQQQPVIIGYADLHGAVSMSLGSGRRLFASGYLGDNRFGTPALEAAPFDIASVSDEYVWRNRAFQGRYSWLSGARTLMQAGAWTSAFVLTHPFEASPLGTGRPAEVSEFNEVVSTGAYAGLRSSRSPRFTVTLDASVRNMDSDTQLGIDPRDPTRVLATEGTRQMRWIWESSVDTDWRPADHTHVTAGSRVTYLHGRKTVYAEPRLGIEIQRIQGGIQWTAKAATGLYRQYFQQFDVASWSLSAVLPTFRAWVPLDRLQRPPVAVHVAGDIQAGIPGGWTLGVRTYEKRLLRVYEVGVLPEDPPIVAGSGRAAGVAGSVKYDRGGFSASATYERSVSVRELPGRFGGLRIATPWEQPERLSMQVAHRTKSGWHGSVRVEHVAGMSWAFRRAYYHYLDATASEAQFNLLRPDRDRLPAHSQVDVSTGRTWDLGRVPLTLRLDILNLTGRRNTTELRQDAQGRILPIAGIPRLVSITVRAGL